MKGVDGVQDRRAPEREGRRERTPSPRRVRFLVVGTPRSGTTVVQRLACELPGVSMPPETHFFRCLGWELRTRHRFPMATDEVAEVLGRYFAEKIFADLDLDATEVARGLGEVCPDVWSLFEEVVRYLCPGGEVLGEKTPDHVRWWRPLAASVPHLRFVGVVRDPRDVVASNLAMPWGSTSHAVLAELWRMDQALLAALRDSLPPSRRLVLRYEDVVRDPMAARRAIARLLGLPAPRRLAVPSQRIVLPSEWYKRDALGPITPARIEAWRGRLSPAQAARVVSICRRGMQEFGYSQGAGPLTRLRPAERSVIS